jgi:hypothetical protein
MAQRIYEHVASAAGFSGESFDIGTGTANAEIIDVLLSVGDGILTCDAPLVLVSTGVLGGARALDISALEAELAGDGGASLNGRFFFLSVQNSDIATNNITVSASGTINGATELIASQGDYLFWHVGAGVWICNILPRSGEGLATVKRVSFAGTKWVNNEIKILQSGVPGAGEVGPHSLTPFNSYVVYVVNTDLSPDEGVIVETAFDTNGDITLKKAAKAPAFAGIAVIVGSLD